MYANLCSLNTAKATLVAYLCLKSVVEVQLPHCDTTHAFVAGMS